MELKEFKCVKVKFCNPWEKKITQLESSPQLAHKKSRLAALIPTLKKKQAPKFDFHKSFSMSIIKKSNSRLICKPSMPKLIKSFSTLNLGRYK